jgi:uncharacterized protein
MKKIVCQTIIVINIFFLQAQELPRKGWFGARVSDLTEAEIQSLPKGYSNGIKLVQVVGGTSAALQLLENDIVLNINDTSFQSVDEFGSYITSQIEGNKLNTLILRQGKTIKIKGKFVGRPREQRDNAEIIYDSAPFENGRLSVIINKPKNAKAKLPGVLFIPGYTCSSVDGLTENHPYGRIVNAFSDAGFVVLRIEKSGLGDSENTRDCSSTTLLDEVATFKAGLEKLKTLNYVDTSNIFIFGHSMGGIIAPALSANSQVKGVMVYGTTSKSWFEYQLEMNRLQLKLAKVPPLDYEERCRIQSKIVYEYFIEKKELSTIAQNPEMADILKSDWQYDAENNMIFDRNQEYWRQIQDYPLLENWKNTQSKVLVLFGKSDFQAFSLADHEQIVNTVNHYHPNNASLIQFDETDHYFAKSGTMENAYDMFSSGKILELFEAFNPEVTETCVKWAKEICVE